MCYSLQREPWQYCARASGSIWAFIYLFIFLKTVSTVTLTALETRLAWNSEVCLPVSVSKMLRLKMEVLCPASSVYFILKIKHLFCLMVMKAFSAHMNVQVCVLVVQGGQKRALGPMVLELGVVVSPSWVLKRNLVVASVS